MIIESKRHKRKGNPRKGEMKIKQKVSVTKKNKIMKGNTECKTETQGETREERSTVCISYRTSVSENNAEMQHSTSKQRDKPTWRTIFIYRTCT